MAKGSSLRRLDIQAAQARARRAYPRSKGFQAAYLKGWRARTAGLAAGACPYDQKLHTKAGTSTWAFAWRTAWMQGWMSGARP